MPKLFTATAKELLLLKGDRSGLLVLFMMPALLVLIITLVQENVLELTGQCQARVALLDQDGGPLGAALSQALVAEGVELVRWDPQLKSPAKLESAVRAGRYQAGLVLSAGASVRLEQAAGQLFSASAGGLTPPPLQLTLFLDPGMMPAFRSALQGQLRLNLEAIALERKLEQLSARLGTLFAGKALPAGAALPAREELRQQLQRPLLQLEQPAPREQGELPPYNPVQQNVPAWALFGMFFTAIPIAGSLLEERKSGIWIRLATLPVSSLELLGGKLLAYLGVSCAQFALITLIGTLLFPALGLPAFTLSHNLPAVVLIVLSAGLAAAGFGLLLGMICTSYEQASTLGATGVVTAAALGGVMVPVYAMPLPMQQLSRISPLNWGLTAFNDLLSRGYSMTAIGDELGRLLSFFVLSLAVALLLARSRS
ncbi:ABC transporter permease [Desulfogranum mediterraneum]|uniref:ABC transporter permease n=1 Tax=Desulfogranum mediterraneum TaxID=160661 RepID=UPI000407E903|nr:ABC transporter permease [Desulfogranum mediterraneum]